ncbi:MAG: ABC transporter ATP-binding protein [Gammaproteobacteria bacterium]|nr:ABC transporter ATP-binding protein [Gammaproteobacteria bacterium]MCW8910092.1 ABC transporter ATP-binding protein [Gammaproteobacteria bacterium]MCW9005452.1 ABC transporter ATP-binding protein [Gammaproteobacteria bacterium]
MKALQINQLKKRYKNGTEALKGVDLEVNEGDFFALLGPNGAGKSTTIGIISGLVNKSSGNVQIFDKNLDLDPSTAKSYIGLVPQEFNFNQFEPVEEILINQAGYYGINRRMASKRAEKYLRQLELWDKRRSMARELSGGMKRRLMIARALIHEPRLLILDEPTAGVDIEIRRSMWDFLRTINQQGTTIILTTHYLEEAESLCKNIAIIDHGIAIENTSMRKLLAQLNMETFILYLDKHINDLPQCIPGCGLRIIDQQTLEVDIEKSNSINQVFKTLSEHKINVLSMRNKSNRLEQLFMHLVEKNRHNKELVETLIQTSHENIAVEQP